MFKIMVGGRPEKDDGSPVYQSRGDKCLGVPKLPSEIRNISNIRSRETGWIRIGGI